MNHSFKAMVFTLTVLLAVMPLAVLAQSTPIASPAAGTLTPLITGLTNPRGFTWGADGTLYLALGGNGGATTATVGGTPTPLMIGDSASVIAVKNGCQRTVAANLPSYLWTQMHWVWGAMDVAMLNGDLYVLSGGGGVGLDQTVKTNGVYKINNDGTTTLIADLSAWFVAHPPKFIAPDYEPSGSLFAMIAGTDGFYVSEAVGGRVMKVGLDGSISLVADLSPQHPVPTGLALAPDGGVYVGFETAAPFPNGSSKVIEIHADRSMSDVWTGLTMITSLATGPDGSLYVEEMATGNSTDAPYIHAGTGMILHRTAAGAIETVADHLDFPVGLGVTADGTVYVSGPAFGADNGEGWFGVIGPTGGMMATPPACATPAA
jgi:hypothetical protein